MEDGEDGCVCHASKRIILLACMHAWTGSACTRGGIIRLSLRNATLLPADPPCAPVLLPAGPPRTTRTQRNAGGVVGVSKFLVLPQAGPGATTALTLLALLPCLASLWRTSSSGSGGAGAGGGKGKGGGGGSAAASASQPAAALSSAFSRAVAYSFLCGFVFGYHVHEKAVLVVSRGARWDQGDGREGGRGGGRVAGGEPGPRRVGEGDGREGGREGCWWCAAGPRRVVE